MKLPADSEYKKSCKKAFKTSDANEFFGKNFTPYQVSANGEDYGLFTGYHFPQMRGSLRKHGRYKYPVYKKPDSLKLQHSSRCTIENGALQNKNLELLYVDDKIELFFTQIQGSGTVKLEDGGVFGIGYDGANGHDYKSIGRYMVEQEYMDISAVTADSIKQYLRDNPSKIDEILNQNQSYIFFRKLRTKMPIGGSGVELTAERSLAIDKRYIPYGTPVWLETTLPNGEQYNRLLIAQDTGGAIKGGVRGDVFFGAGKRAAKLASAMKQDGSYYMLLP